MYTKELQKRKKYNVWIENAKENGLNWDQIRMGNCENAIDLENFLLEQKKMNFWDMNVEQWQEYVDMCFNLSYNSHPLTISDPIDGEEVDIPSEGCFSKYINKLELVGYSKESLDNITLSTTDILSRLQKNTERDNPIRGLVMGNVQSGKTANMAALISLAADHGFNFFIVLSGTIENLRVQTETRLYNDLKTPDTTISFDVLQQLSASEKTHKLSSLHLEPTDYRRYLTVCLKNGKRLENLLNWLNSDKNKKSKLKVLVIDDESDQAGVNTADASKERTKISKLINKIVFADNVKDGGTLNKYQCMNYIAYTATPYANFLNEAGYESLYPRNFISTLKVSNEYFGPQQIFGANESDFNGLSIINEIPQQDIDTLYQYDINDSLKDSLYWFICTLAIFRKWQIKKPVTMLIHTSQKQNDHQIMEETLKNFFNNIVLDDVMKEVEDLYKSQTNKFTKDDFKSQYETYGIPFDSITNYPTFNEIKAQVSNLIESNLNHIKLNDEGSMEFSDNIHLCVDNCYKTAITDENEHVRLIYPDKCKQALGFIVIGGATLSRGLTLEGLTTSYFVRSTQQADSLMQMGRWFGYRKGYELLPRIWLSSKCHKQFEFLSNLDEELRTELHNMILLGRKPSEYGPRINTLPKVSMLKVTSKNKMKGAMLVDCDYSGIGGQTIAIYRDDETINFNYDTTINFLNSLGDINENFNNSFNDYSNVWLEVDYNMIFDYLMNMKMPKSNSITNNFDEIKKWYETRLNSGELNNWNVVLYGLKNSKHAPIIVNDNKINVIERRPFEDSSSKVYKFGVISDPKAMKMDIDEEGKDLDSKLKNKLYRNKAGYDKTPILVVYIINKESSERNVQKDCLGNKRVELNANQNLVAFEFYIPSSNGKFENGGKLTVEIPAGLQESDIEVGE